MDQCCDCEAIIHTLTLAHLQKTDKPRQFSFEARNENENENENGGEWTRLLDMNNIEWLESEKSKTFYFYNNKAYNQYRFINLDRKSVV